MDWGAMPPLSALRAFAVLAETGSFTAAGERLGVSHAAISQQVRGLEERLGTPLARRDGRSVRLTAAGEQLAAALSPAFAAIARAVAEIAGVDAGRPLQVSTTPTFAARWLMPRLSEFRHEHPSVEIMLQPTPELVELAPGGVDVAVRYGGGRWPGLDSRLLVTSGIVVVAARSLVGDDPITDPRRLLDFPWLQELGTSEMSEWLEKRGVVVPRKENVVHLPGYLVVDALLAGGGVTVMSRSNVEREVADGRVRVLFADEVPGQGYYIVTRPGVMRPPLRAFVAWLARHAPEASAAAGGAAPAVRRRPSPAGRRVAAADRPD